MDLGSIREASATLDLYNMDPNQETKLRPDPNILRHAIGYTSVLHKRLSTSLHHPFSQYASNVSHVAGHVCAGQPLPDWLPAGGSPTPPPGVRKYGEYNWNDSNYE